MDDDGEAVIGEMRTFIQQMAGNSLVTACTPRRGNTHTFDLQTTQQYQRGRGRHNNNPHSVEPRVQSCAGPRHKAYHASDRRCIEGTDCAAVQARRCRTVHSHVCDGKECEVFMRNCTSMYCGSALHLQLSCYVESHATVRDWRDAHLHAADGR